MLKGNQFAGIQYLGEAGISKYCKEAVIRLIQSGDTIEEVKILSVGDEHSNEHCLLLKVHPEITIAIKSGFASGYNGEGPRAYSYVLGLLNQYTYNIAEYYAPHDVIKRLNNSCLTIKDLDCIDKLKPITPYRWVEYIRDHHCNKPAIFKEFPLELPLAIIDHRLLEFAISFSDSPDTQILNAYRLLESIVREKTGLKHESSTKLFSKAFMGDDSILYWGDIDGGESKGRASLFTSVFMAYRNNRAHQEPKHALDDDIREFLLINQLFNLEAKSKVRHKQPEVTV